MICAAMLIPRNILHGPVRPGCCAVVLAMLAAPPAMAADFYVSPKGNDSWTGLRPIPMRGRDGPFATLERALTAARESRPPNRIFIRDGTYYLPHPITLGPQDSNLTIAGYENERPVLSGGVPVTGWARGPRGVWAADMPAVREGKLDFRLLRVGDDWATLARYPDFDPANPYKGGWSFVARGLKAEGAFGRGVGAIHNAGDWIEWTVDVPADGAYRLWFRYAALNKPYGADDMAGRFTMRVDRDEPVTLRNLPDTGSWDNFQWSHVATLRLTRGRHVLRWTNVGGGGINFDAFALCNDPGWTPDRLAQNPPAPDKRVVVVQAESFSTARAREMQVDEAASSGFTDRFAFREGDIHQYRRPTDAEIHIFPSWGWVSTILHVTTIDYENRVVTVEKNSNASQEIRPGNRYFVANVVEELDRPGEWCLDRAAGRVLYIPRDEGFAAGPVVAAVLDHLIEIAGKPAPGQWVEGITISGLEFRDTSYSRTIGVYEPADAAIWLSGARNCTIENNRFINVGGYAVHMRRGSTGNQIIGNEIGRNGQGGVILRGRNADQPTENVIAGNWIHHGGRVYKHVAGIYCTTASGTRIAHNLIEHMPRYGVSLKSYSRDAASHNNVVEYNEILFTNLETSDSGAIETLGRDKQNSGNVIQYNRILDVVGLTSNARGEIVSPYMTWGIYLDDYSSGTVVRGNIVARHTWGGVCVHGGRENVIDNNVFVDGSVHQVRYQVRDDFCRDNRFVRNIIVWRAEGADLFRATGPWSEQVLRESDRNLFWFAGGRGALPERRITPLGTFAQWQAGGYDRRSIIADPEFAAPERDDYRLRPSSPALRMGFARIPVEKIGLRGYERSWKQ